MTQINPNDPNLPLNKAVYGIQPPKDTPQNEEPEINLVYGIQQPNDDVNDIGKEPNGYAVYGIQQPVKKPKLNFLDLIKKLFGTKEQKEPVDAEVYGIQRPKE